MTPDQLIKAALDGTFTSINDKGEYSMRKVPPDFMPRYFNAVNAQRNGGREGGIARQSQNGWKHWNAAEITRLKKLYESGLRQFRIIQAMGRSRSSVQKQLKDLRAAGKIL